MDHEHAAAGPELQRGSAREQAVAEGVRGAGERGLQEVSGAGHREGAEAGPGHRHQVPRGQASHGQARLLIPRQGAQDYTDIFSFLGSHVYFVGRFQVADTSKEPNLLKHRDVKNAILESAGKKAELGTVPTFPEFVDYVVAETRDLASPRDWKGVMTWKSYYAKCLPCDVRCDEKYLFTKIYLTTKNILQQEN